MGDSVGKLECMDVPAWRAFTNREMISYLERIKSISSKRTENPIFKSRLVIRKTLSPVDVYCYLKARFGEPNGFQNRLRHDTSDNLFHWDFNLKAAREDVYISGTYREVTSCSRRNSPTRTGLSSSRGSNQITLAWEKRRAPF